jgi:hypothetical protein
MPVKVGESQSSVSTVSLISHLRCGSVAEAAGWGAVGEQRYAAATLCALRRARASAGDCCLPRPQVLLSRCACTCLGTATL